MKKQTQKNKDVKPDSDQLTEKADTRKISEQINREYGGRKDGLDPTRYGDWEKNGRCIDF